MSLEFILFVQKKHNNNKYAQKKGYIVFKNICVCVYWKQCCLQYVLSKLWYMGPVFSFRDI